MKEEVLPSIKFVGLETLDHFQWATRVALQFIQEFPDRVNIGDCAVYQNWGITIIVYRTKAGLIVVRRVE